MIPFKLDYVIEQTLRGGPSEEQKVLRELAGVKLTPAEASAEWGRVLEHKWFVSERLGRDVGLRVAAIDYFENVRLPRHTRTSHASKARARARAAQTHSVVA
jgi:transitional endoplasmic reticulum ATPase